MLIIVYIYIIAMILFAIIVFRKLKKKKKNYPVAECTKYDRIAIDHSVLALHAYDQYIKKIPINFSESITDSSNLWVNLSKPLYFHNNYEFHLIEGYTGLLCYGIKKKSMLGLIFVNYKKKIISICFRNSRNFNDIMNLFQLTFNKCDYIDYNGYFHKGYCDIFQTCIPSINDFFLKFYKNIKIWDILKSYSVIVTGHSLGGSLAVLCSSFMVNNPLYNKIIDIQNKLHLITFGAPYVGTKCCNIHHFSDWLSENILYIKCFESKKDLIPKITNFTKFRITSNGKYKYSTHIKLIPPMEKPIKFKPIMRHKKSFLSIDNSHDICKYRSMIYDNLNMPYVEVYIMKIPYSKILQFFKNILITKSLIFCLFLHLFILRDSST